MEEPQEMQIDGGKQGDEFYEKIEAPKFVDFTAPDQYCPDDRYWFCLRVGEFLSPFSRRPYSSFQLHFCFFITNLFL
jgi:hypothetical protein